MKPQFKRAAVSIAVNISEGSSENDKEFTGFLRTSFNAQFGPQQLKEINYISEEIIRKCRIDLVEISE